VNKADVYRKAAEIIGRDGHHKGALTSRGATATALKDTSLAVCALGACVRAEWELYGTMPMCDCTAPSCALVDPYSAYVFVVENATELVDWRWGKRPQIHGVNDSPETSAEDIALLLKKHAEELDGG
jgi:hypothetical protein